MVERRIDITQIAASHLIGNCNEPCPLGSAATGPAHHVPANAAGIGVTASLKAFRRRRARQWKIASARTSMLSLGGRYWGRGSVKALCGAR